MKLVLCHGCFDILHVGHFTHLSQARRWGDRLVVSVTAAKFVNKGPGHPAHTDAERIYQLMRLRDVDEVWLSDYPTAIDAIRRFRPAIFAKGTDYAGSGINPLEASVCREVGAEIRFTDTAKRSVAELTGKFLRRNA